MVQGKAIVDTAENKAKLQAILTSHVVPGRAMAAVMVENARCETGRGVSGLVILPIKTFS
jgi:uncharacterized surface protein with fasciclin (FAS1) repeats